jgi:hypothetical protein
MNNKLKQLFRVKQWEQYENYFQITIFKYLVLWFSIVLILAGVFTQHIL